MSSTAMMATPQHHLFQPSNRMCVWCGFRQVDVQQGKKSKYCKGPTGMWPVPEDKSCTQTNVAPTGGFTPQEGKSMDPAMPASPSNGSNGNPSSDSPNHPGFNQDAHRDFLKGL